MAFVVITFIPSASFLIQSIWLAFFSNQSLCVRKEAQGARLSGHTSLLSFETQQDSFHMVEVGKAVARLWKENIQSEGKYSKISINCQKKKVVSYKQI